MARTMAPKAVRKRIEAHLRWLRKELARVGRRRAGAGGEGEPGVEGEGGPPHERPGGRSHTLSATLALAELPELEHLDRAGTSPRWSEWRR
jgi:hypothetical protein